MKKICIIIGGLSLMISSMCYANTQNQNSFMLGVPIGWASINSNDCGVNNIPLDDRIGIRINPSKDICNFTLTSNESSKTVVSFILKMNNNVLQPVSSKECSASANGINNLKCVVNNFVMSTDSYGNQTLNISTPSTLVAPNSGGNSEPFTLYFNQYIKSITSSDCKLNGNGNIDLNNLDQGGALSFNAPNSTCHFKFVDVNGYHENFTIYTNQAQSKMQSVSECSGDNPIVCSQSQIVNDGSVVNIAY